VQNIDVVRSEGITSQGIDEIETGQLAHGTKVREGAISSGGFRIIVAYLC
jgi:hypothetical protein